VGHKKQYECDIPNCPACKLARERAAAGRVNKYLPRRVPVAPGQMKLFESSQKR
jgi:hypothetical protein